MQENQTILKKILKLILSFGPGIFAIGYTIGTGSVTSMIVAGSTHGKWQEIQRRRHDDQRSLQADARMMTTVRGSACIDYGTKRRFRLE